MTTVPVLAELDDALQAAVAATRERVAALHAELPRWGLVVWTAGNVSERVTVDRGNGPEPTDLFVIKPSGVSYDELSAENMVVCTLEGTKIADGTPEHLVPSSDTAAHASTATWRAWAAWSTRTPPTPPPGPHGASPSPAP